MEMEFNTLRADALRQERDRQFRERFRRELLLMICCICCGGVAVSVGMVMAAITSTWGPP